MPTRMHSRTSGTIAALIALGIFVIALLHALDIRGRVRSALESIRETQARRDELQPLHAAWRHHRATLEHIRSSQPHNLRPDSPFASPAIPPPDMVSTNRLRIDDEWIQMRIESSWSDFPLDRLPALFDPLPHTKPPWRVIGMLIEPESRPTRARVELEFETLLWSPET